MHAHEETLKEVVREKKEEEAVAVPLNEVADTGKARENVGERIPALADSPEQQTKSQETTEKAVAVASWTETRPSPAATPSPPPDPAQAAYAQSVHPSPRVVTQPTHTILTVGPRPLTFLHTLLRPPPTYLAPLRILHYYTLYLLLPVHMHESYLPPPPDRVVFLDCAIGMVVFWLVVMCVDKFAGDWVEKQVIEMGLIGVGGVAGVAVGAAAGGGAPPAAITGHGRPELERPGQLGLQVDGTTLGVVGPAAGAPGGRVPVGNNGEGELRRHQVAEGA
jgi:hypothetical protein